MARALRSSSASAVATSATAADPGDARAAVKVEPVAEQPAPATRGRPGHSASRRGGPIAASGSDVVLKRPSGAGATAASGARAGRRRRAAKPGGVAIQNQYKRKHHAKRLVFEGKCLKTSGGLHKRDLKRNKRGSIVSKRLSQLASRRYSERHLDLWVESFMEVRNERGLTGFVPLKRGGALQAATEHRWKRKRSMRIARMVFQDPSMARDVNRMLAEMGVAEGLAVPPTAGR